MCQVIYADFALHSRSGMIKFREKEREYGLYLLVTQLYILTYQDAIKKIHTSKVRRMLTP